MPIRPKEVQTESIPSPKVEGVVSQPAKIKKKGELAKLSELFFYRDAGTVKSYIWTDVLVPSGKKALSDIARNTVNMITEVILNSISMALYGEPDRIGKNSATPVSKVSYQRYYDKHGGSPKEDLPRKPVTISGGVGYSDIVFQEKSHAEDVLDRLKEMADNHYIITIANLYEESEIKDDNFMNSSYGWADISSAKVIAIRDGYLLKMPRPMLID